MRHLPVPERAVVAHALRFGRLAVTQEVERIDGTAGGGSKGLEVAGKVRLVAPESVHQYQRHRSSSAFGQLRLGNNVVATETIHVEGPLEDRHA